MSEPLDDEAEVIDGVPVLAEEPEVVRVSTVDALSGMDRSRALALRMPAPVQAVAAGLGGFLAGAAIVAFVRRRGRRSGAELTRRLPVRVSRRNGRERGRRGAGAELLQVVASRSLLVDVHLLGSRDGRDRR